MIKSSDTITFRQYFAADGKNAVNGTLLLYDIEARKTFDSTVSVCLACHNKEGVTGKAILCGPDANFQQDTCSFH